MAKPAKDLKKEALQKIHAKLAEKDAYIKKIERQNYELRLENEGLKSQIIELDLAVLSAGSNSIESAEIEDTSLQSIKPASSQITEDPELPEDSDFEYDNIPILGEMIIAEKIKEKLQSYLEEANVTRNELKKIIQDRLESTKVYGGSKPFLLNRKSLDRDPEHIFKVKLQILDDIKNDIKEALSAIEQSGVTTTEMLDILDKLYILDEKLYSINHKAQTPTHSGPIVDLLRNLSDDILNFIKHVVQQNTQPTLK